jgi:hypothetical protein
MIPSLAFASVRGARLHMHVCTHEAPRDPYAARCDCNTQVWRSQLSEHGRLRLDQAQAIALLEQCPAWK